MPFKSISISDSATRSTYTFTMDCDEFLPGTGVRVAVTIGSGRMQEAAAYYPRSRESTILYSVVARNLETFLARQQERERAIRHSSKKNSDPT